MVQGLRVEGGLNLVGTKPCYEMYRPCKLVNPWSLLQTCDEEFVA